jgi:hypothetical protein
MDSANAVGAAILILRVKRHRRTNEWINGNYPFSKGTGTEMIARAANE